MFFDIAYFTGEQVVERYLEIAQEPPFNLNWGTKERAMEANNLLGIFGTNGVELTKHDIVSVTLRSFYDELDRRHSDRGSGGRVGKQKTKTHIHKKRRQPKTRR